MKKLLTAIFLILSFVLILDSIDFGHALAMFLLAGVIPGTTIVISGSLMLEFFSLLLGFVLARVSISLTKAVIAYRASIRLESEITR